MADVEFDQVGYGNDGLHIVVIQAMAGIHLQPMRMGMFRRAANALEFVLEFRDAVRIGIFSCVQFHHRCSGAACRIDLLFVRVDEQGHADSRFGTARAGCFDAVEISLYVQPALSGQFFAAFRHQTQIMRLDAQRDVDHFVGDGAFQIHASLQHVAQHFHITVLNVAAVLAQGTTVLENVATEPDVTALGETGELAASMYLTALVATVATMWMLARAAWDI